MLRMYRYRLYPSRVQQQKLLDNLAVCKQAYNKLIALTQQAYVLGGVTLHKYEYSALLKGFDAHVFSQVLQNVSDRAHKSYQHFYRRCKEKKQGKKVKVGYPRFKREVSSITYPQHGFKFVNEHTLYCSKIGNLPIVLHRLPRGKVKTLTIKRNRAGQWYACFACELQEQPVRSAQSSSVGIDVGLTSFATCSDGSVIENPRHLVTAEKKIKKLHRRVSRKKKGSHNRLKAQLRLARGYLRVKNQRDDFLHKTSAQLTDTFAAIVVEQLSITNMVKQKYLAKHIHDASWHRFIQMLSYKAVTRGGKLIKVNPRNTSTTCSSCGQRELMPLHQRTFSCSSCTLVLDRDYNAALNIHDRAGRAQISTPVKIA